MDATAVLELVRERRPLVHCLTNTVTMGRVADALAALGALPVMASAPEEAADMAEHAQALVLNLGTPTPERWQACRAAGLRARERGVPTVLDPVGCGATPWRTREARALARKILPVVVRGNVPEVAALAGLEAPGATLRGVTAEGGSGDAHENRRLAREASRALGGSVIVLTGRAMGVVADGARSICRPTGVPLLARVVGAGDVLTAVVAACCAVGAGGGRFAASQAGLALFEAAAGQASRAAQGPGGFWPHFLDALHGLEPAELAGEALDREGTR